MATVDPKEKLVVSGGKGTKGKIVIDYAILKKAADALRAINHPLRKEVVLLLESKSNLTVTEIYVKLRLEQSVASQHLAILRRAGIVDTSRKGKFIYYNLNKKRLNEINQLIQDLAN